MKNYSYDNKTVYIGLDVHKTTYAYTVRCEGVTMKKGTLAASPKALVTFLKRCFSGANVKSAYEAGFCGFYLHRVLCENGIDNIVVNPSSIESAARERVKTDKKDSLKIAIQLEAGRLRGIHVPSIQQERHREISRLRGDLVNKKRRISNQIKCLFYRHGIAFRGVVLSKKWIEEHRNLELSSELRFVFDQYATSWLQIHAQMQEVEKKLKEQAQAEAKNHEIIESLPGVGLITARFIANELGDMSQFNNVRQLYSFTGLTPREYSSGEHIRLGHISRQGRSSIRKTLVQSAWVAVRYDQEMRLLFDETSATSHKVEVNRAFSQPRDLIRIEHTGVQKKFTPQLYEKLQTSKLIGKKKAIIAIARKLIGRIRACLKRGSNYVRYKVSKQGELVPCTA